MSVLDDNRGVNASAHVEAGCESQEAGSEQCCELAGDLARSGEIENSLEKSKL